MRYVGEIIADCREDTGEQDYSDDNGTPQSVPLAALNRAQTTLEALIYAQRPELFNKRSTTLTGVAAQEEYLIPSDAYSYDVKLIEYSPDGNARNYYPLDCVSYIELFGDTDSTPQRYALRGPYFIVDPILGSSVGVFRVTYFPRFDGLDLRRGTVSSAPQNVGGTEYTSIVLANDAYLDSVAIGAGEYLNVVDRDGEIVYRNIPYTAYSSGSQTITLDAGVLVSAGAIAAGNYITIGRDKTTHSDLPDYCEPYLIARCNYKLFSVKSSSDAEYALTEAQDAFSLVRSTLERTPKESERIPYSGKFEDL